MCELDRITGLHFLHQMAKMTEIPSFLVSRVHLRADVVTRVIFLARAVDPRWLHSFGLPPGFVRTSVTDLLSAA